MKRILLLAIAGAAIICGLALCSGKYETFSGDPLDTIIYTLKNGLKVYMSVNKEEPRIQTYIAVRSGGKNDPSDNTGLAHYLEHIMFKGTPSFGTMDYEAEKPMLDEIQRLFDVYVKTSDAAARDSVYRLIDSVSYEASKLAIPNEYDKMMALIGSKGSNAFTSTDVTCYIEDIPSNQTENWAKVQADRFKYMVVRGFHTELEAVYEEKNMSLVNDTEKAMEKIDSMLFRNHPYGLQTVIGTQDHLKNPSITAIISQKEKMYVPNNCAICLSGDFDPDNMVEIIEKYFGDWEPNPALPEFTFQPEEPSAAEKVADAYGHDAEFVLMGWRFPGNSSKETETGSIVAQMLYNGMAGLLDLNVNQQQRVNGAFCFLNDMTDYSELLLGGYPKEGQSLKEVKEILCEEVARLRSGDFDDDLVTATVNNMKLEQMKKLEKNSQRAMMYVDAFISGTPWKDVVSRPARLEATTKEDVIKWAGKYLTDNELAVVYKHLGEDSSIKKIDAPKITPIVTNRDARSAFLTDVQESVPEPIEPVFADYGKDLSVLSSKGMELLYKKNNMDGIATVEFRYDKGTAQSPALALAANYLNYLGTPTRSAEDIAKEMYKLACEFGINCRGNESVITVSGLQENIGQAIDIVEDLIANAIADEEILSTLKADEIKNRADVKLNQRACHSALQRYITYGPEYIKNTTLTNPQLMALTSGDLISAVKDLAGSCHKILYYGPAKEDSVLSMLEAHHKVAENPIQLKKEFAAKLLTPESKVFVLNYKARQFNYIQYSDRGDGFDSEEEPRITLFNEYFGGGMNSIVFQEMREARALAYSAGAYLASPSYLEGTGSFAASIASQNDKLRKSVTAFDEIINDMPKSDKAFEIARTSLLTKYRTSRTTGMNLLHKYLADKDLGLSEPLDRKIFEAAQGITMEDLVSTAARYTSGLTYVYGITGDVEDLDMSFLRTLGPVKVLTLEEVFGY
ncbi:MAG: insulinase family protein [Bacteroidales bacterium]|nr:insulinase family protein [Bacteroidales bacterium]